tara:strand:- start:406 stop:1230 length:825 start_codon:yes stop_codon:yes gene_type:complete
MKKIILGASGMLGHMVFHYLKTDQSDIIPCSRSTASMGGLGGSLTRIPEYSEKQLSDLIQQHRPCKVINCVGITNITESAKEIHLINSELPVLVSEILDRKNDGSQLIQISTNGVFSGKRGNYVESDKPDATDIYGQSKLKGEVARSPHLTIRASILGPELKSKNGLLEWFLNQRKDINGYTEVMWNGVTTLEYAKFIDWAIGQKLSGLIHLFSKKISKFDLLNLTKEVYEKKIKINPDGNIKSDKTLSTERLDVNYVVQNHREMLLELKNLFC